jgi:hyperosmotically inducible protein
VFIIFILGVQQMTLHKSLLAAAALLSLLALSACEQKGPAERAGEQLDNAVENAGDKIEDATDDASKAVEQAGDKVENATDK